MKNSTTELFNTANSNAMLGDVFSILEKEPPVNKPLLVCSFFDANNNIVRYKIGMYRQGSFFTNDAEILNVGFWAELKNCEIIDWEKYNEFSLKKIKEEANFWIKRFLKWKDEFIIDEFINNEDTDLGDNDYIKKFLEQYYF